MIVFYQYLSKEERQTVLDFIERYKIALICGEPLDVEEIIYSYNNFSYYQRQFLLIKNS